MPWIDQELPFSGRTPLSRHHSYLAAESQRGARGAKKRRMLAYIREQGMVTDQGLQDALGLPIQSICSLRNGLCSDGLVVAAGEAMGRYGRRITVWGPA